MRYPDTTKKTSTPTKPPGSRPGVRWLTITIRTASARMPWMSGRNENACSSRWVGSQPTCAVALMKKWSLIFLSTGLVSRQ